MVGALLNVGAGNLDTQVIAQKLAMGSKDGPGEIASQVGASMIPDPSSCNSCLSLFPTTAAQATRLLMPLLSILHSHAYPRASTAAVDRSFREK